MSYISRTTDGAATEAPLLVAEASQRQRQYLPYVTAAALSFVCLMYLMVAWTGYAIYGEVLNGPSIGGNILKALSYGPATVIGVTLICIHVFSGYGVIIQPVLLQAERFFGLPDAYVSDSLEHHAGEIAQAVEKGIPGVTNSSHEEEAKPVIVQEGTKSTMAPSHTRAALEDEQKAAQKRVEERVVVTKLTLVQKLQSLAIRFCVCGFTLFLAELIPFFGDLLNLTGAFTATASCFYIPYAIYLKYFWKDIHWAEKVLLFALILIGLFVTVAGTIVAVEDIIKHASTYSLF